jgi:uncharacterized protein
MSFIGPISRWRQYSHVHRLEGCKCSKCKKLYYPKCHLCSCGSQKFSLYIFKGTGKLLTFTEIISPPKIFESQAPYFIGIIELDEKINITTQITSVEKKDLKIGLRMQTCFRKFYKEGNEGVIQYGLKFKPSLSPG